MYYIDSKYLGMISPRLPRFKSLGNDTWNCRCIICGDSMKNQRKARGYFYKAKESIAYKCFNCSASMFFSSFLKETDPELYRDYKFEILRENMGSRKQEVQIKTEAPFEIKTEDKKEANESLLDKLLDRLDKLPDDNIAVKYCLDRMIPRKAFKKLYFIDDIRKVDQLNEKYKERVTTEEPRLFIPFHDIDGSLVGGTMRALGDQERRYVTVKIREDAAYIFGILDADQTKPLYVCEGPLDSLFIDNAIAVGGSSLSKIKSLKDEFDKIIYVYDNQPNNKEICKLMEKQITEGCNLVIWPSNIRWKDINDMAWKGKIDVQSLVNECVYSGIKAKVMFSQWRKC